MSSWFSLGSTNGDEKTSDPVNAHDVDIAEYSLCDPNKTITESEKQSWTTKAKKAGENLLSRWKTQEEPQPSTSNSHNKPRHAQSSPSILSTAVKNTASGIGRMWHNVKYSKRVQLSNAEDSYENDGEIWLLGRKYDGFVKRQRNDLANDYSSRIWLTYRTGFPELPVSTLTTDCGWGCMLRSAQMMFAQAVLSQRLSREWRFRSPPVPSGEAEDTWAEDEDEDEDPTIPTWTPDPGHKDIICLFEDCDSPSAPLGLHALLKAHQRDVVWNMKPEGEVKFDGRWFAPSEALLMLRESLRVSCSPLTADIALVYNADGRVVMPDIESASVGWTKSVVLAVCLRLGASNCYYPHFQNLFAMETCLGLIGGRPKHSLYFVGCACEDLIYLDPHIAHPYAPFQAGLATDFEMLSKKERRKASKLWRSFQCTALSRIPIEDIDPSMAVAMLFRNRDEMAATFEQLNLYQVIDVDAGSAGQKRTRDPLFTVFHEQPPAFDGSEASRDAHEVASAREHGFELL